MRLPRLLGVVLFALGLGGCAEPPYTNVDNAELKALVAKGVPLYDIRRPEEWRQTRVEEGSRTLTYVDAAGRPNPGFLSRFTAEVGKNDPVVLICRTGSRTDALARELAEMGYTQIYNVRHGITRWIGEGNPVARNGMPP
jgi:rhodanese-related sulfurtransferase